MSSIVITVKSNRSVADLTNRIQKDATSNSANSNAIEAYFEAVAGGAESSNYTVAVDAANPVAASGTATLTYGSLANNDTLTVAGVTLTLVTGTPSGAQAKIVTDGPTTAANIVAAVNALATLNIYVVASASSSVVTFTANQAGVIGNLITLAKSSSGIAISAANLAGGTGGVTQAGVNYARGL